jgi:hypothetical protein
MMGEKLRVNPQKSDHSAIQAAKSRNCERDNVANTRDALAGSAFALLQKTLRL